MDGSSLFYLITAGLLLLANGLFVTAEFSLVGLRRTKIEELVKEGRRGAQQVKEILAHLDAHLSTCQVGITLASLGLGWIGERTFARSFEHFFLWVGFPGGSGLTLSAHAVAVVIAFLLVTFLHVVIGELAPKTLALQFPENLALWIAWPMRFFHRLFWPLTWLLNHSSLLILRTLGLRPPPTHARVHSEEELGMILDESLRAGELSVGERRMLERVFRFHDKTIREIMVPRPDIVALEESCRQEEVIRTVFESGFSRLPVYKENLDKVEGTVYVKDLIYSLHHPELIKLPDLVRPVLEFPEAAKVSEVLHEFQRKRIHMAIVVDEFGDTAGLVTLEDIVEEIVGEIQDETDHEPAEVQRLPDGVLLVDCKASVERFEELFPGMELPEGEFDTVGGLVLHLAGRLPREGDAFRLGALIIRVVKREGRRIRRVAVRHVPPGKTQQFQPLTEAVLRDAARNLQEEERSAIEIETHPLIPEEKAVGQEDAEAAQHRPA